MAMVEYKGVRMTKEGAEIAEREGLDVWSLKRNLEMTIAERIQANERALRLVLALEEAGKNLRNAT
jgi:hypothetical protein